MSDVRLEPITTSFDVRFTPPGSKSLTNRALVMAALGNDGGDYLMRLQDWGLDTSQVLRAGDTYTAQCMIITDEDNNQITAFHPGAMQLAHNTEVPTDRSDIQLAIIAPDGRDAMLSHAAQLAAAKIPFVFDPGQGLPMFNGDELRHFVAQATWVAVNDYEAAMVLKNDLTERLANPGRLEDAQCATDKTALTTRLAEVGDRCS